MQDASMAAKADEPNTTQHLQDLELNKMAASVELQKVYSELTGEGVVPSDSDLDLLQDPKIFQNEALLVSLSQVYIDCNTNINKKSFVDNEYCIPVYEGSKIQ